MTNPFRKTALLALLVVLCTAFIFSNSLKDIEHSTADSDVIVEVVEKVAEQVQPNNTVNWNYYVRKCAHLMEFCALGILTMCLCRRLAQKRWSGAGLAALYGIAVAFVDEWIQRFTGRGDLLSDVILDSAGAVLGIGLILLADWTIRRHRSKKGCNG